MPLPDTQFDIAFIRTLFMQPIIKALNKHYGLTLSDCTIPLSVFDGPMTLIPFVDVNTLLEDIETQVDDPAYLATLAPDLTFEHLEGGLGQWFLATPDLSLSFRRINYGTSCLQSGATFYGQQSGNIIKWCYNNHFARGRGRLHDSLRMAIMFTNALRYFMGQHYVPLNVEISGPPCGYQNGSDAGQFEAFFGCSITWNAPQTKVWLDISILEHANTHPFQYNRPMMLSNLEMDEFLNMPQPHDTAKVFYELINYSRYYGYPQLDFLAERLQLSRQQLQRRLHHLGWSFTAITNYVLCNQAIKYMQIDMPIKDIATALGYANSQSFSKAFQRQRGQTPAQYKENLLERSRG
ncbi:helix-turn-helix domain-containing protein [Photobacterium aphoticum]|uniref:AraC family transcriptional regulator n=1 Tax=Photobacterium aphoticum TaxID=754436 RepID=A0A0J1GP48_9GAMM|nr:AraC family transcriptional regulator [Photobacterium aphoticum]KLV01179.1 AraC family transcriptional regulator [Photobacterium aphoticum]PSU56105.1 AraC family transcriptional regulator [Photobacterium aphoticum]GHA49480.1 AraC family transcriptional regulator [Photobacterium aphoticum]